MDHPPGEPVLKVCYFRYYAWFAEIQKFKTGIFEIVFGRALC